MGRGPTIARPPERLREALGNLAASPALLPCAMAVVVFVALGASEAGFYPIGTDDNPGLGWYPAGLLLLALSGAAAIAGWPPRRPPRSLLVALGLLAGYAAWSYLSIAWADQQAVAWDGANRTVVYLAVFALFALWPLGPRNGLLLIGLLGLGIAGLGLVELLKANGSAQPEQFFSDGRFTEPAGYINANVALWTIGLWPCLHLAGARAAHPLLRGLALGGAVLLASLALMGQSRGWVFAVPLASIVFVALAVDRARALAALALAAIGTLIAAGSVLAVHDDVAKSSLDSLLSDATGRVLAIACVLALVGVAAGVADRLAKPSREAERTANRAAVAVLALVLVVGSAGAIARAGDISDSWETFKGGGQGATAGESRFASVGTNRYDFWTVAWDLFAEHPVHGIGSENFQPDYLVLGNSEEQPRYPHSLELGVLSQTGLVGFILLGGALAAAGAAAARSRRRGSPAAAAVSAGAATVFAYWLLHGSVDWFWEFPGIAAPALAMLGLAAGAAAGAGPPRPPMGSIPGVPRRLALGLATAATVVLALSMLAPWFAEREVDRASRTWSSSAESAFDRLESAKRLNPLSPKPGLTAATIAIRLEDQDRAVRELESVLEEEPRTPFALAELGALAYERGEREKARRLLERAVAASPRDDVVRRSLELVRSGGRLDVESLNKRYLDVVARFDRE